MNIKVALDDAFSGDRLSLQPVLFSICLKNYQRFTGIRLCSENYSSYPCEQETLLMEEASVFVLAVEDYYI
jgi:hypothetical protein